MNTGSNQVSTTKSLKIVVDEVTVGVKTTHIYACFYNTGVDRPIDLVQVATDFVLQQIFSVEIVILADFYSHHF